MPAPAPHAPAPAPHQSAIMKLLHSIGSVYSNPNDAALLGMASGFGAASAPHMLTPVSMGQAMNMANQGAQQYRQQALSNAIQQQAMLPYQVARTHEAEQAVSGQNDPSLSPMARAGDQALAANIISPGMGATLYANNPSVVAQKTLAETLNQLQKIPANERAVLLAKAFGIPAQGALPEATRQAPGGAVAQMPGAPVAMAANAANRAGGAANATYPYQAALSFHTRVPGQAGATLGPRPAGFAPVGPPPVAGGAAPGMPGAANAAREAAMREQIGLMNGVSGAANAVGRPAPFAPPQQGLPSGGYSQETPGGLAPPGTLAAETAAGRRQLPALVAQLKAAQAAGAPRPGAARPVLALPGARGAQPQPEGGGIFSPGESVAAYNAQKAIGAETGTAVESAAKESDAARQQVAIYNQMSQALSQMGPTGAWRDVATPLGHLANYFGFKPLNITSAAEFRKFRAQLVGAATHAVSPRASTQEMDFLAQQVPNYDMPGNAPRVLLSELRGLSQYQILKDQALPMYMQRISGKTGGPFRGTSLAFNKWWINSGPSPSAIVMASVLNGLSKPEAASYVNKLRATLTGRHMIRQYERALQFQAKYPGIFQGL